MIPVTKLCTKIDCYDASDYKLTYLIEIDEDSEPGILKASGIIIHKDPEEPETGRDDSGSVLSVAPVPVDEESLEDPDSHRQSQISRNRVDSCLKIGQLDDIILHVDIHD